MLGKYDLPSIVILLCTITSLHCVSSQFPPLIAAKSIKCVTKSKFQDYFDLYPIAKIEYYKDMKRKKSLTQKQYVECYTKALTYVAQILVAVFFIAVLIFSIF